MPQAFWNGQMLTFHEGVGTCIMDMDTVQPAKRKRPKLFIVDMVDTDMTDVAKLAQTILESSRACCQNSMLKNLKFICLKLERI